MAFTTKLRASQATASRQAQRVACPRSRVATQAVRASSQQPHAEGVPSMQLGRREVFLGAVASMATMSSLASPVKAEEEYETFLGYATPPTSYAGYGGNAKEDPRYTFEYPAGWKREVPNKVEKGTQGIDGRVVNPRSKDQRAFVITLQRAGEDNKSFRLTDLDSTLSSFAGADYNLQDALQDATFRTTSERDVGGYTFYDYDIESPEFHYLVTITVSNGKVFGLFVRSPTRAFPAVETKLRNIISTFKLL